MRPEVPNLSSARRRSACCNSRFLAASTRESPSGYFDSIPGGRNTTLSGSITVSGGFPLHYSDTVAGSTGTSSGTLSAIPSAGDTLSGSVSIQVGTGGCADNLRQLFHQYALQFCRRNQQRGNGSDGLGRDQQRWIFEPVPGLGHAGNGRRSFGGFEPVRQLAAHDQRELQRQHTFRFRRGNQCCQHRRLGARCNQQWRFKPPGAVQHDRFGGNAVDYFESRRYQRHAGFLRRYGSLYRRQR